MKIRTKKRIIIALVMVFLVIGSSIGTFYVAHNIYKGEIFVKKDLSISFGSEASKSKVAKFREIKNIIDSKYYKDFSYDDLIEGAISGMINSLNDPYTHYYTKEQMEERNNQLEGYYYGIGVTVSEHTQDYILIDKVAENSPAAEVSLEKGDKIISIDGMNLSEYSPDEIYSILKTKDKHIELGIQRGEEKFTVEITVRAIEIESVIAKTLDDNIGYIRIVQFDSKVANTFENELKVLLGKGINRLIIDLRNNGGGLASEMTRVADTILPEGNQIYYEVNREGETISSKYSDVNSVNIPIVVLVNSKTASASELLASTLRDNINVPLVGTKTFGKAIAQESIIFDDDGSGLVITVSQYFTPSGYDIQGKGLIPDVEVGLDDEYKDVPIEDIPVEADTQLNKAIEVVKGLKKGTED